MAARSLGYRVKAFSNVPIRKQLTHFVPPNIVADIEAIRRIVDPVQSRLIPAHVTLCREDELPGIGGTAEFQSLREVILAAGCARPHAPHLTLAHPRNLKAPGNDLHSAAILRDGLSVTFEEVHLIEQVDDVPWIVRGTFLLRSTTS